MKIKNSNKMKSYNGELFRIKFIKMLKNLDDYIVDMRTVRKHNASLMHPNQLLVFDECLSDMKKMKKQLQDIFEANIINSINQDVIIEDIIKQQDIQRINKIAEKN